jgi:hypothetical protein
LNLRLGPADDPVERQAEQAAATAAEREQADGPNAWPVTVLSPSGIAPGDYRSVKRSADRATPAAAGSSRSGPADARLLREVLPKDPGARLPAGARAKLEPAFGADFGHVRIHTGEQAAKAASAIGALAYSVGSDLVFGAGEYAPETQRGLHVIAHELAHVVSDLRHPDQERVVRRTTQAKIKVGKGKAASTMTVVVGGLEFSDTARDDVLKRGGLLPGPDQAHVAFNGSHLAYDVAYTAPQDPFRWNKIKDLIDSDEKIKVDKVGLTDNVKVKFITPTGSRIIEQPMLSTAAAGLTLPTEALAKAIYPKETTHTCSPLADSHQIYYTGAMSSSASQSELAHELMGHMWLAIKKVPFVHPHDPQRAKAIGTLSASHGIQDPLGATFTGTVEDYISKFVSSQSFAAFASPTQFVSPALFAQSVSEFKAAFAKGAKKGSDGRWSVSDGAGLAWEKVSNNFRFAASGAAASVPVTTGTAPGGAGAAPVPSAAPAPKPSAPTPPPASAPITGGPRPTIAAPTAGSPAATTSPATVLTQAAAVQDLAAWYRTLPADQKYVLERMLDDIKGSFNRNTDLATALGGATKP